MPKASWSQRPRRPTRMARRCRSESLGRVVKPDAREETARGCIRLPSRLGLAGGQDAAASLPWRGPRASVRPTCSGLARHREQLAQRGERHRLASPLHRARLSRASRACSPNLLTVSDVSGLTYMQGASNIGGIKLSDRCERVCHAHDHANATSSRSSSSRVAASAPVRGGSPRVDVRALRTKRDRRSRVANRYTW